MPFVTAIPKLSRFAPITRQFAGRNTAIRANYRQNTSIRHLSSRAQSHAHTTRTPTMGSNAPAAGAASSDEQWTVEGGNFSLTHIH